MAALLLKAENLHTYLETGGDTVKAVDDISFEINKGETFCLVGESGSGKSITALSILQLLPSGIATHPKGNIHFNYRHDNNEIEQVELLTLPDEKIRQIRGARITMIFQEPMNSLNPVYTIGEQIMETLQVHWPDMTDDEAKQKAVDALKQVQIPHPEQRIDAYPHQLSGGQRQRVMIAMAMVCEPDLLIADEPTTALDVTVQAEILRLMKDLQERKGTSILFITHDFGVVAQMAHKIAVMRKGKFVEYGEANQVLGSPQHEYTKQLLAALPENLKRTKQIEEQKHRHVTDQQFLLELDGIKVHFPIKAGVFRHTAGYVKAVDDIDIEIKRGKILALVGESGCGKTTLGRAILRLEEPTAGRVHFDNTEITALTQKSLRQYRHNMQFIFQDPMSSLNPRLTIATTLLEPMAVHGIGENREERIKIAKDMLQQVQLEPEHLWRYPHEFSGGQRQRIGIARALVLNPKFIVCDEITSALDVSVQAEILEILLKLSAERDLTLLFITHNISVVDYLSDEIAVMYLGRIVEQGPTEKVINNPQHPYTQALLSAVPVFDKSKQREVIRLEGEIPSPSNPPTGCHFHPRCSKAMPICKTRYPDKYQETDGAFIRCFLFDEKGRQETG